MEVQAKVRLIGRDKNPHLALGIIELCLLALEFTVAAVVAVDRLILPRFEAQPLDNGLPRIAVMREDDYLLVGVLVHDLL